MNEEPPRGETEKKPLSEYLRQRRARLGLASEAEDERDQRAATNPESLGDGNGEDGAKGIQWIAALTGAQFLKEVIVLLVAGGVLCWLLLMLSEFMNSISQVFLGAAKLYSAPVAIARTFDWHLVLLGVSLVVGVSAIVIVLLKSVFNGGASGDRKADDGLKFEDMPAGQLVSSVVSLFKPKG